MKKEKSLDVLCWTGIPRLVYEAQCKNWSHTQENEGRDGYTHYKVGQCGVRQVIGEHLYLLCCRMEACSLRQTQTDEHRGSSHSLFNLETLSCMCFHSYLYKTYKGEEWGE